jgi:hypothetical protein
MDKPQFPNPVAAGETLAKLDPTQGALFVLIFVVVCLMTFIAWRELTLTRLIKAIDKMSDAMWAWRLAMAEQKAEARAAEEERVLARRERSVVQGERRDHT